MSERESQNVPGEAEEKEVSSSSEDEYAHFLTKKPDDNTLPLFGNKDTMNIDGMILTNILESPYFNEDLLHMNTFYEVLDEVYYKVQHLEPWEKYSKNLAGHFSGLGGVAPKGKVSTPFCLLFKLFTLRLTRKQVNVMLNHSDSPHIRGLGFLYIRYCQPPKDFWDWFCPYLQDEEEIELRAGGGLCIPMGEMCQMLLTRQDWFGTMFPHIPVNVQTVLEEKLKQVKQLQRLAEEHTLHPVESKDTGSCFLPNLQDTAHYERSGVSFQLDPQYQSTDQPTPVHIPAVKKLKKTVAAYKESLALPVEKLIEIEVKTRQEQQSPVQHCVKQGRISASHFGDIIWRKSDAPLDSLVLAILEPQVCFSSATDWAVQQVPVALEAYVSYQHQKGKTGLTVEPCGVLINEKFPYLEARPDGKVFDPSNEEPDGFVQVKCPYSHRDITPLEACSSPEFCCKVKTNIDGTQSLEMRQNHQYYAQVQGQMAIGGRNWCDFVIYTNKGISVERVMFDSKFCNMLFPKLEAFFDNCLGPEIVCPVHVLGQSVHNLM